MKKIFHYLFKIKTTLFDALPVCPWLKLQEKHNSYNYLHPYFETIKPTTGFPWKSNSNRQHIHDISLI